MNEGSGFFGFEEYSVFGGLFFDGLFRVGDDGAGFGVGHQTFGAQNFGIFDELGHLIRRSIQNIEIDLALFYLG